jgi:hypothetical protein
MVRIQILRVVCGLLAFSLLGCSGNGCNVEKRQTPATVENQHTVIYSGQLDRGVTVRCIEGKQYLVVVDSDGVATCVHESTKGSMKNGEIRVLRQGNFDRGIHTIEFEDRKYLIVCDSDGVSVTPMR